MGNAIFLDRDGVINIEKNYLYEIDDFEFIDGVFEALNYFQRLNYKLVIITNQSGIGLRYYSEEDFQKLTKWMLKQFEENGITIDKVYHCHHAPNGGCNCRKPRTGMIEKAITDLDIDISKSWLIGDKESDIQAGIDSGIVKTILVRSGHIIDENTSKADYVLNSIIDAIDIII